MCESRALKTGRRLLVGVAFMAVSSLAAAQDMHVFRIGTGGVGGTYYPLGSLIARAIGQPPDSEPCSDPKRCGVPGLVAVAQSANGSVANIKSVGAGLLESGFAQSDVAHWAFSQTGIFKDTESHSNLRAIAGLYPETIHLVARRESGIRSVADLEGKRVSLDEPGSGTLVDARLVLHAYGLSESDLEPEYIKPDLASERIRAASLDAFFIVAGHPVKSVQRLAESTDIVLIPIDGGERSTLIDQYRFFSEGVIESGVYNAVDETPTVTVHAVWVTRSDIEETLIYNITRALWNDASRRLLDNGHVKGREVKLENALEGLAIPLHPGAERYYGEVGMIP